MAKIILHIGDGKCGSTAIQNSLYKSRDALKKSGIYFDTITPNSGHSVIPLLVGQSSRVENFKRIEMAEKTVELLKENFDCYDWIVLSAESLINLKANSVNDILALFGGKIEQCFAIAYVREPSAMYLSSVQQILKGSHIFPVPEQYRRRVDEKLATWRDIVGVDRLTVRAFSRSNLVENDVVADFEQWLGAVTGRSVEMTRQAANISMTAEQTQVMQIYRANIYPDCPGKIMPRSTAIAKYFSAMNEVAPIGSPIALSALARGVLVSRSADVVANLKRDFPSLSFPVKPVDGVPDLGPSYPWHSSKDVSSILDRCDPETVDLLCKVVPDLQYGKYKNDAIINRNLGKLCGGSAEHVYRLRQLYEECFSAVRFYSRKERHLLAAVGSAVQAVVMITSIWLWSILNVMFEVADWLPWDQIYSTL